MNSTKPGAPAVHGSANGQGGGGHGSLVLTKAMFASLTNRDFFLVWISNLGMMFAMQMQMVARGWLIYEMTDSALALAWVMFSFMLPILIFSLVGGVLADRLRKKGVMIASQGVNTVATLVLATIIVTGNVTYVHFILFGILNGLVLALSMPARQAIIPEIVGEKDLANAFALNTASMNLSRILGPSLAGVIITVIGAGDTTSAVGVGVIFYIIAGLYLLSIITLRMLRHEGRSVMTERQGMAKDIGAGLKYIRNNAVVLGLLIVAFIPLIFGMPIQFLLPVFNKDVLGLDSVGLGLLIAAIGVGALIGSLVLAGLGDMGHKWLLLLACAMGWAISLGLFAVSTNLYLAMVLLGIVGLFSSVYMAMNMTLAQLATSPDMRGRVMSLMMMTFVLMPIGVFPMSILAENVGIGMAVLAGAADARSDRCHPIGQAYRQGAGCFRGSTGIRPLPLWGGSGPGFQNDR